MVSVGSIRVTEPKGQRVGKAEFIALMAMMFATIAFSTDAMLPVMPEIAADLTGGTVSGAAYIVTFFFAGMGAGTFVAGPLSDAWGRKPVVYLGLAIYALGAILCWVAPSLEWMLAARVLQGFGASGPRVVSNAIIRDLYDGRVMARIMSFTMMVFLLVPGIAPLMGALIADAAGWRAIFAAFLAFGLRMRETLPQENRRPMRWAMMTDALRQMFAHPTVRLSILVQMLMLSVLFAVLTMVQPIFDISFGRSESFPIWFGVIAMASGISSFVNASLVGRFGMRRMITWALSAQLVLSTAFIAFMLADLPGLFGFYVVWQFGVMVQGGLTVANLNALAMHPMGHIAGMAASVIGSVSTIGAAVIASPFSALFDGTPMPLVAIVLTLCALAMVLMLMMRREEKAAVV